MNLRVVIASGFLVVLMWGCARGGQVKAPDLVQRRVEVIANKFSSGEIERIEVVHIPLRILTRTRINPEMIEKSFHYKLTITAPGSGAYKDALNQALNSMSVKPEAEIKDIRWGVIFYSARNSRIGALYLNDDGSYGSIDDEPVSFKDKQFFRWLDGTFSSCLR